MTNHTKKGVRAAHRALWLLALPAVFLSTACQDGGITNETPAPQLGVHADNPVPPDAFPVFESLILCKEWTNAGDIATDFDVTVDDLSPGGTSTTLTRTLTATGSRECREVAMFDGTTNFSGPANLQTVEILPANTTLLNIVVTAVDPAGNVVDATGSPYFSTVDVATGTWSAVNADQFIGFRVEYFNELLPILEGRMTGGGSFFAGHVRFTHGFELHCDPNHLPNNLEINWRGSSNRFHLTTLTSGVCTDDPAISPLPRAAPFDTYVGTGVGTLNGVPGATISFTFTDAGEGGSADLADISIVPPGGGTPIVASNTLKSGNHQAHPDN